MRGMVRRCGQASPRIIAITLLAGAVAGCSTQSMRLGSTPLFAGSTANPAPDVERRDLAPIGSANALVADPAATPAELTVGGPLSTPAALRDRGWTVDGAPVVQVGAADTAATLSQGYGVPVSVILEANGLAREDEVRTGQRLVIPTPIRRDDPGAATPLAAASAADPNVPRPGPGAPPTTLNEQAGFGTGAKGRGTHVVAAGETLWSISQRYGVSPQDVITLNNLPPQGTVKLGETLRLPGGAAAQTKVAALTPQPQPGEVMNDASPAPAAAPPAAAPAANAAPAAAPASATGAVSDGASGFRWPVRGRIIAGFGKQADGARNEGIDLAVPAGTPVRAAEAGTVIYAGNELEGYGNLVLIQHKDDWVSAYAYNETLTVRRGDKVERGQAIATAGSSGAADQPQVHFELRKRSKPVDPLPYLSDA